MSSSTQPANRRGPTATTDALSSPLTDDQPADDGAAFGAIRTLRLLFIGTIVVPLLLGAIGGYLSYRATYQRAEAALAEAVAVAEENTIKVLDTHVLVAARIEDLLDGLSDDEINAGERSLHERLAQQIKDVPQVAAAWVVGATGHELVSARVFPVDRDRDHAGREDFQALQNPGVRTFVWALRARSLDRDNYRAYFTLARRWQAPDGRFRGIVVIAVSGDYFASFYNSLLGGTAEYIAGIFREDGKDLAHYPERTVGEATQQQDEQLARAIADKAKSGIILSGSRFGSDGSLIAYKRLAEYPVYVTIGRMRAAIAREWLASVAGYGAVGAAAAIGLMLLSLVALRRTRREQIALAQARDAVAQRASIEAQLHQAQKMEAVGLLTAGIAHDFNNLLTVASANITLLEMELEDRTPAARKFIAAAISGCERAAALAQRLLDFSRRGPVDPQPLDVNEVITGMSDLLLRSMGGAITGKFRLADGLWPVLVDPNQLENSLLNLALNARDAMSAGGRLVIETGNRTLDAAYVENHPGVEAGEYVGIFVSDSGTGMPRDVVEKAFDPFFTTKETGKGSGLGLSQVYGFVTRSGGHCTIDSEPGQGTTVRLYLPRYSVASASADPGRGDGADEAEPDTAFPVESDTGRQGARRNVDA